jgi:hypothetical protein
VSDVRLGAFYRRIKRIVYAALSEDANEEQMIVHNLTLP